MTRDLDLLLINPGNRIQAYGNLSDSLAGIEPPLWCGLIAGFMRKQGFSVKIIDADAENLNPWQTARKIVQYNPLLAGIIVLGTNPSASSTPKMTVVRETLIALKEKSPDIKTVLAGLHPSALPEKTLREEKVDFICQGEGFYTFLGLLEALKSNKKLDNVEGLWYMHDGRLISNPPLAPVKDLDELPFVAWDLLPMDKYRAHNWHCFEHIDQRNPYAVIYTSLGCPFNCYYCPIHALYGSPGIRFRSPENVIEEIGLLVDKYKVRNIKIMDELFVLREEHVSHLCDLIIQGEYKLNIWAYARIDTIKEDILKKMKQAGINWLCFGIESASRRVREDVSKRIAQEKIKKAIEMTRNVGIYTLGNFIFGLPEDDIKTMHETLEMAKEFNFEYVNFYAAMAYPGSQLYNEAIKNDIKLPQHWHGYGQYSEETLPMPTKYLSAAEVLRFRDKAFREYFSNPEYLKMIQKKFGTKVVEHIKDMFKLNINRRYV